MRGIQSIAGAPQERAADRATTARRLLSELSPYRRTFAWVMVLVVLGAVAQAGGPWLIGRAIDLYILEGDATGLARTMLFLLAIYALGTVASRGQVFGVGAVAQRLLASLRERIFERL